MAALARGESAVREMVERREARLAAWDEAERSERSDSDAGRLACWPLGGRPTLVEEGCLAETDGRPAAD